MVKRKIVKKKKVAAKRKVETHGRSPSNKTKESKVKKFLRFLKSGKKKKPALGSASKRRKYYSKKAKRA